MNADDIMDHQSPDKHQDALYELGRLLLDSNYDFTTITPLSHARVLSRCVTDSSYCTDEGRTLRDIFGWSKPFERAALPPKMISLLEAANVIEHAVECAVGQTAKLRCNVRFSTIRHAQDSRKTIYVHSSYPTTRSDAVFFGPDTYRFVALVEHELQRGARASQRNALKRIVDIGCGAGPGGIAAALKHPGAALFLADINPTALQYASVNAHLAGIASVTMVQSDLFAQLDGQFDLIVSNPPYLLDADARVYRHGGGAYGSGLATRIVLEGLPRLSPDGTLILYSGVPIVDGKDVFRASVESTLREAGVDYTYTELDPDVFGEELESPGYENVERIAAIALVIRRATQGQATQERAAQ
ncbi:MAG: SAM-dependent methyltransferase [Rhodocyclales bacterium]|nr:SAM-dependent methyltransferase [Rhodocyclales bacterium]